MTEIDLVQGIERRSLAGTILVAATVFAMSRWSSVLKGPYRRTTAPKS